jgi:hypothetical protein
MLAQAHKKQMLSCETCNMTFNTQADADKHIDMLGHGGLSIHAWDAARSFRPNSRPNSILWSKDIQSQTFCEKGVAILSTPKLMPIVI